jgi:HD-GYP domain-containing protein (c-di-GMP phosphodiesterase class II)
VVDVGSRAAASIRGTPGPGAATRPRGGGDFDSAQGLGRGALRLLPGAVLFASLLALHRRSARLDATLRSARSGADGLGRTVRQLRERVQDLERHRESDGTALRKAQELAALALAKTLMLHDPVTGSHLERLPLYTGFLAAELCGHPRHRRVLLPELVHVLPRASTLHDVGKLGIPEHILRKSAPLTLEEFAIMKRHTTVGGRTLQELARRDPRNLFLAVGCEIALYHHERWDGSGYPFGLRGPRIPLVARIVALADVYDALTSERPYKRAYAHSVARRLIVAQAGAHFDPDVVEAFLACEEAFLHTRATRPAPAAELALGV